MKRKQFESKMRKLTIDQIIDLIKSTWNDQVGDLFREIGFDIIEEREGEEESDRIYDEIYREMQTA